MGYYTAGGFFSFVSHVVKAASSAWSSTLKPLTGLAVKAVSTVYPAVGTVSAGLARGESMVRGFMPQHGAFPNVGLLASGGLGPATTQTSAHGGRRKRRATHRRSRRRY
jgi:hypothetical protein